jgi:hypothetical protein
MRLVPRAGWVAWLAEENLLLVFDGAEWAPVGGGSLSELQDLSLLGLGTMADATNPFSAKLNAALWTARTSSEGGTGDLFYTMNKEAAARDLGLTLQTAFVTKALLGLFGSDRFRLAVSAGSTFFDGLIVDNANGIVDQPRLPRFKATPTTTTTSASTPGRRSASTTPSTTIRERSMQAPTALWRRSPAPTSLAPRCSTRSTPAPLPGCAAASC